LVVVRVCKVAVKDLFKKAELVPISGLETRFDIKIAAKLWGDFLIVVRTQGAKPLQ
jgi:hypothetical protein